MAFVIAPLLGLAELGAVGSALVSAAASVGLSLLARSLAPSPSNQNQGSRGMRLSLKLESNADREWAFGTCASAGSLHYHNSYGPNGTDYVQLVFALADHECDSLTGIEIDGVACTLGSFADTGSASGLTVVEYPGVMWVQFHNGAWDQAADADLIAHAPNSGWTANDRGRGICYVRVTMLYNQDLFKSGQPHFLFVFRGAKAYDLRKDTTAGGSGLHRWNDPSTYEWSDNPVVGLYNFRRGIAVNGHRLAGLLTAPECLPASAWMAAASICDEDVIRLDDTPEKRYRACGLVSTSSDNRTTVREFVTAMGGAEIDSGGILRPLPGASQSPVMYLTDDDLMSDEDVEITPKLSRNELANAIFGTFHDPLQHFESIALPPRISSADEDLDGGVELQKHFTLDFCPSPTQGQRILEILRRRERYQRRVKAKFRSRCVVLEAGDWISWTSDRYGFSAQTFEIISAQINADLTVTVAAREVDGGIYAWSAATDEITGSISRDLVSGRATFSQVQDFAVATVLIDGATGAQRPGIGAAWHPITDATVTGLEIQYRRAGDTAALTVMVLDASTSSYVWVTGVQGGVTYEVRARPVTVPARPVVWTGWVSTASDTPVQVVDVAVLATAVPPGTITIEMLSAQAQMELATTLTVDGILADAAAIFDVQRTQSERDAEAAIRAHMAAHRGYTGVAVESFSREDADKAIAQQIATVAVNLATTAASVTDLTQAVATADTALGLRITSVASSLQTTTAAVTDLSQSVTTADTALGLRITSVASSLQTTTAAVADLSQSVTTADAALALRSTNLETTVGGHTSSISTIQTSVNGVLTHYALQLNSNGQVIGAIQLDGSNAGSQFTVVADKFLVALPGVSGGTPTPVFAISNVNGVAKLAFRGDMIGDGTIQSQHLAAATITAIQASIKEITAGRIISENGQSYVDLRTGMERIRMVTAP